MRDESPPAPGPLIRIDHDLLDALKAWGGTDASECLDRFAPGRRASLRWEWSHGPRRDDDPEAALERLRRAHRTQTRPDLSRIHVSWWMRALRDETESVRLAVVAALPRAVADAFAAEFPQSVESRAPERAAEPGTLQGALALWSSQLVGDLPERADDPPVIAALTRLDAPSLARLIRTTGLAKWALTAVTPPSALDHRDHERFESFRRAPAATDARFVRAAEKDVAALHATDPRAPDRAGLATFARLLNSADLFRARWALQHLPYATAKIVRALMGPDPRKTALLARWESDVFRVAVDHLHDEGRLPDVWEALP
jgi:hypothetical protein